MLEKVGQREVKLVSTEAVDRATATDVKQASKVENL
jgi:hypothetical protein